MSYKLESLTDLSRKVCDEQKRDMPLLDPLYLLNSVEVAYENQQQNHVPSTLSMINVNGDGRIENLGEHNAPTI